MGVCCHLQLVEYGSLVWGSTVGCHLQLVVSFVWGSTVGCHLQLVEYVSLVWGSTFGCHLQLVGHGSLIWGSAANCQLLKRQVRADSYALDRSESFSYIQWLKWDAPEILYSLLLPLVIVLRIICQLLECCSSKRLQCLGKAVQTLKCIVFFGQEPPVENLLPQNVWLIINFLQQST